MDWKFQFETKTNLDKIITSTRSPGAQARASTIKPYILNSSFSLPSSYNDHFHKNWLDDDDHGTNLWNQKRYGLSKVCGHVEKWWKDVQKQHLEQSLVVIHFGFYLQHNKLSSTRSWFFSISYNRVDGIEGRLKWLRPWTNWSLLPTRAWSLAWY